MWLTPAASSRAIVASALSCPMLPSAAAPKMTRVDWWPVLPKVRVGSMLEEYLAGEMPFAQHTFEDLARPRLRQRLRRDLDDLRDLVAGDEAAAMQTKLIGAGQPTRMEHDNGVHRFAPHLVRHSEHGGLRDAGMTVERVFDLDGVHVLGSRHDHVLGPIDNEEIVPIVEVTQ